MAPKSLSRFVFVDRLLVISDLFVFCFYFQTSNITRMYDILSDVVLNLRVHSIPYPHDNGLDDDWMEPGNAISSAFCYLKKLSQTENVHIPRQVCRKSLSVDTQPHNHLTFSIWMYAILRDARQQLTQIMDILLTNSFP